MALAVTPFDVAVEQYPAVEVTQSASAAQGLPLLLISAWLMQTPALYPTSVEELNIERKGISVTGIPAGARKQEPGPSGPLASVRIPIRFEVVLTVRVAV